jgi:2-(1,2-epoxy-1,2-dihydrophenyl)acetyl-CoA isomerase
MSVTDTDRLLFKVEDMVATITLNFPEKLNAFNNEMLHAWAERLRECRDRDDVRVIVVTGAGRGFCSGGDTGGMGASDKTSPRQAKDNLQQNIHPIALTLETIDKPVICALNGVAAGAGLDMALHCDIRYAAASARFAETYTRVGLVPGNGAAWFLPRIVGVQKALEMLWTAEFVNAEQAKEIGLVLDVFPDDVFMDEVMKIAKKIANNAPISVRYIKRLVYQGQSLDLRTHFDQVSSHMIVARTSQDHVEAIDAMRNKREPKFTGT